MPYVQAAELSYTKVRALNMSRTICFQPVSALEVHGPHLPLGMDYYMAKWMAEESGRRFADAHPEWTVVQLPPLPLGTDELPLAGSMNAAQRTVYGAVMAHGRSLVRAGYRYIVLTNGHGGPRHASALEHACRRISKRYGVHMIVPSNLALYRIITGQRMEQVEALLGRPLTAAERAACSPVSTRARGRRRSCSPRTRTLVEPAIATCTLDGPPAFTPLARLGERLVQWRSRGGRDAAKLAQGRRMSCPTASGWLLNATYGYGGPTVTYQGDPSVASAEIGARLPRADGARVPGDHRRRHRRRARAPPMSAPSPRITPSFSRASGRRSAWPPPRSLALMLL